MQSKVKRDSSLRLDRSAEEIVVAGIKAQFSYEGKRRIIRALEQDLSPELSREESCPYPRMAPPGLAG